MTKQEEIREGLRTAILENTQVNHHRGVVFTITGLSNILKYLHSQGVVIKVDRELPKNPYGPMMEQQVGYRIAQERILKAGYVAVEPLIEEKK